MVWLRLYLPTTEDKRPPQELPWVKLLRKQLSGGVWEALSPPRAETSAICPARKSRGPAMTGGRHEKTAAGPHTKEIPRDPRQVLYEEAGPRSGVNLYLEGSTLYAGFWKEGKGAVAARLPPRDSRPVRLGFSRQMTTRGMEQ
jgi:hypothetical protein